jgi:ribosome-associated protein
VITRVLEDRKAVDIVSIDLHGRVSFADVMVIASALNSRHMIALADHIAQALKDAGHGLTRLEGLRQGDWVLIDAGSVIVHLFRPDMRGHYEAGGQWLPFVESETRS